MFLKTIAPFFLLLCSCSNNSVPAKQPPAFDARDYEPPTDFEWSLKDRTETFPVSMPMDKTTEEQNYTASISRINSDFADEQLQLRMCSEVHKNSDGYCASLLKRFCAVDEYLDTRGHIHRKPYCF